MHKMFGERIKLSYKENILRIAEKIKEISKEKQIPINKSWQHLSDLLRLQIVCKTQQEVLDVILTMAKWKSFIKVLRFKSRLGGHLNDVTINFAWDKKCCCEL